MATATAVAKEKLGRLWSWAQSAAQNVAEKAQSAVEKAATAVQAATTSSDPEAYGLLPLTPRIFVCGFPDDRLTHIGRPIDNIAKYLNTHHRGRYMIWNLSERSYDYSKFHDHVIEVRFAGYPAPPLDKIFTICSSIHHWLLADEKNIAVVHCHTGLGRTSATIAAYLAWSGQAKDCKQALVRIAQLRGVPAEQLVIPTQMRYLGYVNSILKKQYPESRPIYLERIIMNGIPAFEPEPLFAPVLATAAAAVASAVAGSTRSSSITAAASPSSPLSPPPSSSFSSSSSSAAAGAGGFIAEPASPGPNNDNNNTGNDSSGSTAASSSAQQRKQQTVTLYAPPPPGARCRPYLQIYKNARLIYSSAGRDADVPRWYTKEDQSVLFPVDMVLDGDILIRIRHLSADGQRITMLRLGFHTGYVYPGMARFAKAVIDGAFADERFDRDFFLDLVFRPAVDADGKELPSATEPGFWAQAAKRPEPSHSSSPAASTPMSPGRVSLFADSTPVVSTAKRPETKGQKQEQTKELTEHDRVVEDLEAAVRGLEELGPESMTALSVNSDEEDAVVRELSRELAASTSVSASSSPPSTAQQDPQGAETKQQQQQPQQQQQQRSSTDSKSEQAAAAAETTTTGLAEEDEEELLARLAEEVGSSEGEVVLFDKDMLEGGDAAAGADLLEEDGELLDALEAELAQQESQ